MQNIKDWIIYQFVMFYMYFIFNRMKKIENKIIVILLHKSINSAIEFFPEKILAEHQKLATSFVYDNYFEDETDLKDDEDYISFKNKLKKNDFLNTYASMLFLTKLYYYQKLPSFLRKHDTEEISLSKAKQINGDAKPLTSKTFKELIKKIEEDHTNLKYEIKQLKNSIIDKELTKYIKPLELTNSHISFVISLMSSLFLLGGFIYTYYLLSHFNINVSNYYTISDYLANSIDVVAYVFISTLIGIIFFFLGMNDEIKSSIIINQLEGVPKKPKNYSLGPIIGLIIGLLIILLGLKFYVSGEIDYEIVYAISILTILVIFQKLPIWDYIANPRKVAFLFITILVFLSNIIVKSHEKIQEIENEKYNSNYLLLFTPKYKEYETMKLITMNSSYLFLLDNTQSIRIIPKEAIVSVKIKNDK